MREVIRMCRSRYNPVPDAALGCACGCCGCGCGPSFRRFYSSGEELECLEHYQDQLKRELAGLEERIQELRGK